MGTLLQRALRAPPQAVAAASLVLWTAGALAQATTPPPPLPPLQQVPQVQQVPQARQTPAGADFGNEVASDAVREAAAHAMTSGDHQGLAFLIVDKKAAKVFVFDHRGRLLGAAAALLGSAVGDASAPGIGDRPLSAIRPEERTTPAGRFFATLDRDLHGDEVLWVDYDGGVALHRVSSAQSRDRRIERLATPTAADNRITYGCINVAATFYEQVVSPTFRHSGGIVYVLPETQSGKDLFPRSRSNQAGAALSRM